MSMAINFGNTGIYIHSEELPPMKSPGPLIM